MAKTRADETLAIVVEAGRLHSAGRPGDAARLLSGLVRARPDFLPGALALADLLRWRRRAGAEALYRSVLRRAPADARARRGLAELALERAAGCQARGRWELAEGALERAAALDPRPETLDRLRDVRRKRAAREFARGSWRRALAALERAGGDAQAELRGLFRTRIEKARAGGRWAEVERETGRLWSLRGPDGRACARELLRGWCTEYAAAGDARRLARVRLWLFLHGGEASVDEVSAGLVLALSGDGEAAGRLRRAKALLTPFLRREECPPSFKKRFADLLTKWVGEARAAGDRAGARALIEWVLSWGAPSAEPLRAVLAALLREEAEAAAAAGRRRAARRAWVLAVAASDDPEEGERYGEAVRQRITALRVRGRWAAARRELADAAAESPRLATLQLQSAALWIQMGRAKEADKVLKSVLARAGGDRLLRFQALAGLARYAEAFREAERVLASDRSAATVRALGWPWKDWLDVNPTPGAAREFRSRHIPALAALIRRGEFLPWAHYYRGLLLRRTGTIVDGAADFDAAARHPRVKPWMLFEAGLSRLYRCDFKAALAALRRTIGATEPTNWMSHAFIGESLVCLRRPEEALAQFERALRAAESPDQRADALAWRGEMQLWLGRYREALASLDEAAAAGARFAPTWRGAAKLRLGRAREALADFDAGVLVYDDVEAWIWRGEAKRLLGDPRGAVRDLNRALRMMRDPWAYFNRALARADLGDAAGMRRDFARIDPVLTGYARRRIGLEDGAELADAQMRAVLQSGLDANPGFRRHLAHQTRSWMG